MIKGDIKVSANFLLSEYFIHQLEFMDFKLIDPKLFVMVQKIRDEVRAPITINSGFRSVQKNIMEKGAKDSQHLYSRPDFPKEVPGVRAVDLSCRSIPIDQLYHIAEASNLVTGLGDGRKYGFIHVDCRLLNPGQPRATWTY